MEPIKNEVYKFFADFVFKKTGIYYSEKDYYRLDKRITDLMKEFSAESADDVYNKFKSHTSLEMEKFLIDICTNNETYFLRDNKPFDALTKEMIPQLKETLTGAPLEIWSCACSTGQEPISIMMSIKEAFGDTVKVNFKATDISTKALAKCEAGIYTGLDVQRGLPIQLLMKYFESAGENLWKAKLEILDSINYGSFNLFTGHFPLNKYHVIFCRNVLIYQNQENKMEILKSLATCLKPGGFLILGAGESLVGMDSILVQKNLGNCMVFTKE